MFFADTRNKFWRCLWKVRAFPAAVKGVTALIIDQQQLQRQLGLGQLEIRSFTMRRFVIYKYQHVWYNDIISRNFPRHIHWSTLWFVIYTIVWVNETLINWRGRRVILKRFIWNWLKRNFRAKIFFALRHSVLDVSSFSVCVLVYFVNR